MTEAQTQELLDRMRRLETRVTRFLEAQGFDTQTQRAQWVGTHVELPTRMCSVKECVEAIPLGWTEPVKVFCKGDFVMEIRYG